MNEEEIKAIQRCQSGHRQEFGYLYGLYVKKIYAFVYAKTGHRETAEDIVSQSFFKALDSIGRFEIGQGTFQSWLYTIARNTITDHYRSKKNDVDIDDCWDLSGDDDLSSDFDTKEKLREVKRYLTGLKKEQRDIVIMRVWQDMSYQEIAGIMGKSEAACKMSFLRAIKDLRMAMPLAAWLFLVQNLKI